MSIALTKLAIPLAGAAVVGATTLGAGAVSAASTSNSNSSNKPTQAQMEARYKSHLDQLVKDGKLTSTQEQAVITEHDQLVAELQAAKSSSTSDKKQTAEKVRQEAESWAKSNNVPVRAVLPHPHRHGQHPPKKSGNSQQQSNSNQNQ